MIAVRSLVEKSVEQVKNVAIISIVFLFVLLVLSQGLDPFGVQGILCHFLQNLNLILLHLYLIIRSLQVVLGTLHDLYRHIGRILEIFGQPHCGKVSPS